MQNNKLKLVQGVGINDYDGAVSWVENGKQITCKIYYTWSGILSRCNPNNHKTISKSYAGVTVCNEWLSFSEFRQWMSRQDYYGKYLDKDILSCGKKVYSPETCVFVSMETNSFLVDRLACRGEWPLGVYYRKKEKKFIAKCNNNNIKAQEVLGMYTDPWDAHAAWKKRKNELAHILADKQDDIRVANALRLRYL